MQATNPSGHGRTIASQGRLTKETVEEAGETERNERAIAGNEIWRNVRGRRGVHGQDGADHRAGSARGSLRRRRFRNERGDEPID